LNHIVGSIKDKVTYANMINKILKIFIISLIHFAMVLTITWAGLRIIVSGSLEAGHSSFLALVFVWISRILYFPVVTLSLFPRNLFPGGMVYLPIVLNSIIWGIFIYILFYFVRICRQRVSRVKDISMHDSTELLSLRKINPTR
jgi:glucan phosphoethanolaminetransferase (alkaline phosphatase superfamily)